MEKRSHINSVKDSLVVVITGAESTGKSILARQLGDYFGVPAIPEYARDYIASLGRKYRYDDVEHIAREQVRQLHEQLEQNPPLIILDTWLVITKVWFEELFHRSPKWLGTALVSGPVDLFLLCDIDLPWVPDPVRENGGARRLFLQQRYLDEINNNGFPLRLVRGTGSERFRFAREAIEALLETRG